MLVTNEWVRSINGIILTEEILSTRTNTCPTATPSTTSSTWTGLEQNPISVVRDGRPPEWWHGPPGSCYSFLRPNDLSTSHSIHPPGVHEIVFTLLNRVPKNKTKVTNVSNPLVPVPRTPCQYGAPSQLEYGSQCKPMFIPKASSSQEKFSVAEYRNQKQISRPYNVTHINFMCKIFHINKTIINVCMQF